MNKTIIIIIAAVLVILSLGSYFIFFNKKVPVTKINIENKHIEKTISASGTVTSENDVDLAFNTTGKISKLYVKKGDMVKQNDLLLIVDTSTIIKNVQAYKDARDIKLREKDLYIEQYADRKQDAGGEEEYNINIRTLDEEISKAQANYEGQLTLLANNKIFAPFDGTVIDIYKDEGEVATVGTDVIKLANLNKKYFEIHIDQEDYGYVNLDQEVKITLDAYDNYIFKGIVYELPKYAETSGTNINLFKIKINMSESDKNILLGMTGDASIIVDRTDIETPSLRFDQLYQDDDNKDYVWAVKNNKLSKVYVETGIEGDDYTQIVTDLSNIEIVIPEGEKVDELEGKKIKYTKINNE